MRNPIRFGRTRRNEQVCEGQHEAIVSQEPFDSVQELIGRNREQGRHYRETKGHVYLLKGLLRCGRCGNMMTPKSGSNGKGQFFHYYQCTRQAHHGRRECATRYVPAQAAETLVLERLKEISFDRSALNELVDQGNLTVAAKLKDCELRIKSIAKRLGDIAKEIDGIWSAATCSQAKTTRSFGKKLAALEEEQQRLEKEAQRVEIERDQVQVDLVSADVMATALKQFGDLLDSPDKEGVAEFLPVFVDVVEWNEGKEDSSTHHFKVQLFEIPYLRAKEQGDGASVPGDLFAECQGWLPDPDGRRTKSGRTLTDTVYLRRGRRWRRVWFIRCGKDRSWETPGT